MLCSCIFEFISLLPPGYLRLGSSSFPDPTEWHSHFLCVSLAELLQLLLSSDISSFGETGICLVRDSSQTSSSGMDDGVVVVLLLTNSISSDIWSTRRIFPAGSDSSSSTPVERNTPNCKKIAGTSTETNSGASPRWLVLPKNANRSAAESFSYCHPPSWI